MMLRVRTLAATIGSLILLGASSLASAAERSALAPVLFRNVNVISMTGAGVEQNRDVLVRDGRIAQIAGANTIDAPAGATIVEASNRYLMPGLAEMHAHVPGPNQKAEAQDVLLLYLAHGITTIRGMLGDPWHLELRKQLESHEVIGPRLYTAGPSFNGNSVPDVARAERMVREQKAAGYDFLKLHPGLSREVFDAIAKTASEADITFEGHVSEAVGLPRALEARQRAIDHLDGYLQALADPECVRKANGGGLFGLAVTHCADAGRIPALVEQTKQAGTWMVPTQILLERWISPPGDAELRQAAVTKYLPPQRISEWRQTRSRRPELQRLDDELGRKFIELRRELLRQMHRAGVPIALGSDAPQTFNAPGDSALAELELYVRIGLSPAEALRTATVNPARFFDEARFGMVREGYEADLILLAANPLEDIRAIRRLEGVMARGHWLARASLDERLAALAARVNPTSR